jgi:hypothetical protein
MGTEANTTADLAEVPSGENLVIGLDNNLYWNGINPIPFDYLQMIQYTDDIHRVIFDPLLGDQVGLTVPHWDGSAFADGSTSIHEAFTRLVNLYAVPGSGSAAIDAADLSQTPMDDILGNLRGMIPDLGAYETNAPYFTFLPIVRTDP